MYIHVCIPTIPTHKYTYIHTNKNQRKDKEETVAYSNHFHANKGHFVITLKLRLFVLFQSLHSRLPA